MVGEKRPSRTELGKIQLGREGGLNGADRKDLRWAGAGVVAACVLIAAIAAMVNPQA